jgi:DNA mismatch repair ATPase MutS
LQERQDAVAELLRPEVADVVTKIRNLLAKLPDLEKDLTCVLHGKVYIYIMLY